MDKTMIISLSTTSFSFHPTVVFNLFLSCNTSYFVFSSCFECLFYFISQECVISQYLSKISSTSNVIHILYFECK